MTTVFTVLLVITSTLLVVLGLLDKGRGGGGLSDMFGGGASSSLGGSSVAERNLDRFTIGVGSIWFACVIALGLLRAYSDEKGPSHVAVVGTPSVVVGSAPDLWRGGARRGRAAPGGHLFLLPRAPHPGDLLGRGREARARWDCPRCGLPASLDSESRRPPRRSSRTRPTWPT